MNNLCHAAFAKLRPSLRSPWWPRILRFLALAAATSAAATELVLPAPAALERLVRHDATLAIYTTMEIVPAADAAVPLLDLAGRALGPRLDELQFCDLAARGSAVIEAATYEVVGTVRDAQVFCGRYYRRLHRKQPVAAGALGRSRFERVEWPYGLGVGAYKLVPWRSVAAPAGVIAAGRALYLPQLRGLALPDGSRHDGHLFVADVRAADDRPAIDLFVGLDRDRADAARRLAAILGAVTTFETPAAADALARLHRR